jgi:hypothetical protein
MKHFLLLVLISFYCAISSAAKQIDLKVFYDCNNYGGSCYFDYIRQQNPLLTFVRDRTDADVHIMLKSNYNSGGANVVTFFVFGKNVFASLQDTLNVTIPAQSVENEERSILNKQFQKIVLPYLAQTDLIDKITYSAVTASDTSTKQEAPVKDKFNYWVFRIGLNGYADGSANYKNISANANVSADRETEKVRTNIYGSFNDEFNSFKDSSDWVTYEFRNYRAGASHIKKLTEHIGLGGEVNYRNSLFSNYKMKVSGAVSFEYSIFPYKEFNTKRLILGYSLGATANKYYDSTIYFKTAEQFLTQDINLIYSYTTDKGSINVGTFWNNQFQDFNKNYLGFNGAISARLVRGFNISFWGDYGFVRNQINIRKGGATKEELLVKNKELLSAYSFSTGIGLVYRFGSTNNSMINPAFKGLNYNISF